MTQNSHDTCFFDITVLFSRASIWLLPAGSELLCPSRLREPRGLEVSLIAVSPRLGTHLTSSRFPGLFTGSPRTSRWLVVFSVFDKLWRHRGSSFARSGRRRRRFESVASVGRVLCVASVTLLLLEFPALLRPSLLPEGSGVSSGGPSSPAHCASATPGSSCACVAAQSPWVPSIPPASLPDLS